MNGAKEIIPTYQLIQETIDQLNGFSKKEILEFLCILTYSIGSSFENVGTLSSEEVLLLHTKKPTIGTALMAQALWMRDLWQERNNENE
jgi:hypothetical protein